MRRVNTSHFFMFLTEVYKHSKWLFAAMMFFIAGQLFINYKHGAVLTPFYHYGMYSGVMNVKGSYKVCEVWQNGQLLKGQDFSPEQWDKIMLPVQYFAAADQNNQLYKTDISRLLSKIFIERGAENFLISCHYQQFINWYKTYLSQITQQPAGSLSIQYRSYQFAEGKLQPTDSVTILSQLCR